MAKIHLPGQDGRAVCGAPMLTRDQAELAYNRLMASYWERWPYNPYRTRNDEGTKIGYIMAMSVMAMIAFGVSFDEAEERVAEDMADHVAGLG